MTNCYNGFKEKMITFSAAEILSPGTAVKLTASGVVTACRSGDRFIGFVHSQRGDEVVVQTEGYVTAPYTGTAPTVNHSKLASDTLGKVKTADTGSEVLVLDVDTTAKTVGFML